MKIRSEWMFALGLGILAPSVFAACDVTSVPAGTYTGEPIKGSTCVQITSNEKHPKALGAFCPAPDPAVSLAPAIAFTHATFEQYQRCVKASAVSHFPERTCETILQIPTQK